MEKYFKNRKLDLIFIVLVVFHLSCNEASIFEGIEPEQNELSKVSYINLGDQVVSTGSPKPVAINFGDGDVLSLNFVFTFYPIMQNTWQYSFFCNPPENFRWSYETYIKKYGEGTLIGSNDFVAGGTAYFINALISNGSYNYTYVNSCKVNESSYVAFQFISPMDHSAIIGWLKFTASVDKIVLHEGAYTRGKTIKIGSK